MDGQFQSQSESSTVRADVPDVTHESDENLSQAKSELSSPRSSSSSKFNESSRPAETSCLLDEPKSKIEVNDTEMKDCQDKNESKGELAQDKEAAKKTSKIVPELQEEQSSDSELEFNTPVDDFPDLK